MCRLLSYAGIGESSISQALGASLSAFTAMSCEHADGWGVAWHARDRVQTAREPRDAGQCARYAETMDTCVTDAALVHLRDATDGLPIDRTNTHPFLRDGIAFAHNGFVGPIPALERLIAPELTPESGTDSERYFLAVLSAIRAGAAPQEALLDVARRALTFERTTSANAILLTTQAIHAVCAYRPGSHPPEFSDDYFALRHRRTDDLVVLSSTGIEQEGWAEMPNVSVLTLTRKSLEERLLT